MALPMTPLASTKHLVTLIALALALATNGCSGLTIVGVSGEKESVPSMPQVTTAALRTATEIDAMQGEMLMPADSTLGDIDGDGYDDFLLTGLQVDGYDRYERIVFTAKTGTVYLFYGRPQFPEHLVSSDADATFETGLTVASFSMGDLNGDGLADFALEDRDGFEIVFGKKQRWTGHHPRFSTGTVVSYPATVIYEDLDGAMVDSLIRLGDLNGDGKDDFAVRVAEPDEHGNIYGFGVTEYIFEGREGTWPSGQWDPSLAVAELGYEDDPTIGKLSIHAHGDLNGDGFSDLMMYGSESYRLYYGKSEGLRGTITSSEADAELAHLPQETLMAVLGDLDGDGADELAAATNNELRIVYGTSARYAGRVELQSDLTIVNQGPYWGLTLADVNGDGLQDLLIQANQEVRPIPESWDPIPAINLRHYAVLGTGTRLIGQQPPLDTVFQPVGYTLPAALMGSAGVGGTPIGDIDGDGSTDLLAGVLSNDDPSDGVLYLLPGTMRAPE
jgi:hypothetical protein